MHADTMFWENPLLTSEAQPAHEILKAEHAFADGMCVPCLC